MPELGLDPDEPSLDVCMGVVPIWLIALWSGGERTELKIRF